MRFSDSLVYLGAIGAVSGRSINLWSNETRNVEFAKALELVIETGVVPNSSSPGIVDQIDPSLGAQSTGHLCTVLHGNGNPHQNPLHTQLTNTFTRGSLPCSVAYSASETYTWGWSLNVPEQWISGGFSVSNAETDSASYTCNGPAGATICLWSVIGTTAYTVDNQYNVLGECGQYKDTSILYSPNTCYNAPNYYCVEGPCRTNGQHYYDTNNAPAGGPVSC